MKNIDTSKMSYRLRNFVIKHKVKTVDDLIRNKVKFLSYKGFGRMMYLEVEKIEEGR